MPNENPEDDSKEAEEIEDVTPHDGLCYHEETMMQEPIGPIKDMGIEAPIRVKKPDWYIVDRCYTLTWATSARGSIGIGLFLEDGEAVIRAAPVFGYNEYADAQYVRDWGGLVDSATLDRMLGIMECIKRNKAKKQPIPLGRVEGFEN